MSPELIDAVTARIKTGHSKETIYAELRQAGYTDDVLDKVWAQATEKVLDTVWSLTPDQQQASPQSPSTAVPTVGELLSGGFSFIIKNPALALLLTVVSIGYASFAAIYGLITPSTEYQVVISSVGSGILFLVYLLVMFAVLYVISHSLERKVTFSEAFTWTGQHVWGLAWVTLLMTAVMIGGYLFLIIPGIILSVILLFSQFAYITEGKKGFAALMRSRDLVKSAPWPIVRAYILVILLLLAFYFIALLAVGLVSLFFDSELFVLVLGQVLGTIGSLVLFHVTMRLYKNRIRVVPAEPVPTKPKGVFLYIAFGVIGAIVGIALFAYTLFPYLLPLALPAADYGMEEPFVMEEMLVDCVDPTDPMCGVEIDAKARANELRSQ